MTGLVHVRRSEKINRSNVYWKVIKVRVGSILLGKKKCIWILVHSYQNIYS